MFTKVRNVTVARYMTPDGKIPFSGAAYAVVVDGKPVVNLTADQLDEIVAKHFEGKI